MEYYIKEFLKQTGDPEFVDLIDCYYRLAEDKIIYVAREESLIAFRTYSDLAEADYNHNFLKFIARAHPVEFRRETKRKYTDSTMYNLWFLHLCHANSYVQAWIKCEIDQHKTIKRISFGDGHSEDFGIRSSEISSVLKVSIKDHINTLLTFKSMFFEEYKEYRKKYE